MPTYISVNRVCKTVVRCEFSAPHCFDTYYMVPSTALHFQCVRTDDGFDEQPKHVPAIVKRTEWSCVDGVEEYLYLVKEAQWNAKYQDYKLNRTHTVFMAQSRKNNRIFSRTQLIFWNRCRGYTFRINELIHHQAFYTIQTACAINVSTVLFTYTLLCVTDDIFNANNYF
jgi:hypothetical protein